MRIHSDGKLLGARPGGVPRRNRVHDIRVGPLVRVVRLHLHDAVAGGDALRDALLEQRRVEARRVVVHVPDVDEELRGVGLGGAAAVLGADDEAVVALHLVVEGLDEGDVAREAVDGELGLDVAADYRVADCGVRALVRVCCSAQGNLFFVVQEIINL